MRHSPRNLRLACDHKGLTHFGGVYFFREFLGVLQFRNFLARQLTYPRRNRRYSLSQMILALVYPLVLGLDRLETVSFLRSNGTFQYLTGLQSFPDPQTLRRFLFHAPDSFLQQMHRMNDRLLQNFIHLPDHRSRWIFDLDSRVVTVFGRQEHAEVLSRQTFVPSTMVHGSQLLLSLGYRTAPGQRGHLGRQRGTDGDLLPQCTARHSRVAGAGRCRVWFPSGPGNSRNQGRPVCGGGPSDSGVPAIAPGL